MDELAALKPPPTTLILERVLPALRPETRRRAMPTAPDIILSATASGELSLEQAHALLGLAETRQKMATGEELLARVSALESALAEEGPRSR